MKLQEVKQKIDNFFMDITQERIKELEKQYQLTKNENWLVLKMDLEEQHFKSRCKELLEIYEKSDTLGFCLAVSSVYMLDFIKELKPFVSCFLKETKTRFIEGSLYYFNLKNSSKEEHREIRIKFLKWLINENNI